MPRQREPLGAPPLYAAFALDVPAQPELRWRRPCCVPDEELGVERVEFLPPEKQALLRAPSSARAAGGAP